MTTAKPAAANTRVRHISPEALAVLKTYETGGYQDAKGKLRVLPAGSPALKCYVDDAGVLTIGWGHTGPGAKPGRTCTAEEAEALLAADLATFEAHVDRLTKAAAKGTTQGQFDAMVLLAFNIGKDGFAGSTGLKRHNAGDFSGAVAAFASWNKITQNGRKVVAGGLVRRRAAEAALYRGGSK
jgi:lysozyme